MVTYVTRFGSLDQYEKGGVEVIDDDPRHYAFSNIFEVASMSKPYEKVTVGKNLEYVLEAIRADGPSEWRGGGPARRAPRPARRRRGRRRAAARPPAPATARWRGGKRTKMPEPATLDVEAGEPGELGYRSFRLGEFAFSRDEYFVSLTWPTGRHVMSADAFLRALQRDVAWDFFYGIINFDGVLGTVNHYGTVDMFAGRYNDAYRKAELDHVETFETPQIRETFKAMLADWTNEGFDPFASPEETGSAFGPKHGDNIDAITRRRVTAQRMVAVAGREGVRTGDNGPPANRQVAGAPPDEPALHTP